MADYYNEEFYSHSFLVRKARRHFDNKREEEGGE